MAPHSRALIREQCGKQLKSQLRFERRTCNRFSYFNARMSIKAAWTGWLHSLSSFNFIEGNPISCHLFFNFFGTKCYGLIFSNFNECQLWGRSFLASLVWIRSRRIFCGDRDLIYISLLPNTGSGLPLFVSGQISRVFHQTPARLFLKN